MDTEIPRYNDREPPIADTMVPVICKMRLYPIGYLLSFMPLEVLNNNKPYENGLNRCLQYT